MLNITVALYSLSGSEEKCLYSKTARSIIKSGNLILVLFSKELQTASSVPDYLLQ